jgi:uncharacterized protein (UPF0332 family)
MSVNAEDFLQSASNLLTKGTHEIDYRNCMSRAYYASFHAVKLAANALPEPTSYKPKGSHDEVICKLTKCVATHPQAIELKAVGNMMQKIKAQRVIADYRINNSIGKPDAEQQFLKAQLVIQEINRLSALLNTP